MKQFVLTSIMKIPLAVEGGAKRIVSSIRVLNARPELRLRAGLKTEQYKKPVEIACLLLDGAGRLSVSIQVGMTDHAPHDHTSSSNAILLTLIHPLRGVFIRRSLY